MLDVSDNTGEPRPTLLLDRDGVINENREDYVRSWEDFQFIPGAVESLAALSQAGFRLVIVTNQSMVGRGLVARADLDAIHTQLRRVVARAGGNISDILVCPHAPQDSCSCRKPLPGMILEAQRRFMLAKETVYFVGDHIHDVQAALAGGCRPILVETGRGRVVRAEVERQYGQTVEYLPDLVAVARCLLGSLSRATFPRRQQVSLLEGVPSQ